MKILKSITFTLTLCFLSLYLSAQEIQTTSINEGSIGDQFDFAIKKSNNYNDANGRSYEVIRRDMILALKKNTLDSLSAIQSKLDNSTSNVNGQQEEINTLKADLAKTQDSLTATHKEKDSMTLLGMQMSKSAYSLLMWSVIAALLALLVTFIIKFKHSNAVTKSANKAFSDLEIEFKNHRKTALEREQKVKRELQDELNKNRGGL